MLSIKERYLVDENDNRVGVLLDMEDYQLILEELEELEAIRVYDEARASGEKAISFEQALADLEQQRKNNVFASHIAPRTKGTRPLA